MTNKNINELVTATTPLTGTELIPAWDGATKKVVVDDLTVKNIRSSTTSGILQVTGPAATSTRVVTVPDANWTAARIDAAQSFTGDQTLSTGNLVVSDHKGITGPGGLWVQAFQEVDALGTFDLLIDTTGFTRILNVSSTRFNYTPQSRRSVYAVSAYGSTLTSTLLHNQEGSGGGATFTLSMPSAGLLRLTDTSGQLVVMYMAFSGSRSYG